MILDFRISCGGLDSTGRLGPAKVASCAQSPTAKYVRFPTPGDVSLIQAASSDSGESISFNGSQQGMVSDALQL